jgi:hypothetical protein
LKKEKRKKKREGEGNTVGNDKRRNFLIRAWFLTYHVCWAQSINNQFTNQSVFGLWSIIVKE